MIAADRVEASARRLSAWALLVPAVGAAVAWLAFDNGSYSLTTWAAVAVAVWWTLALAALGAVPVARPAASSGLLALALGLLSLLSLSSVAWAADAERAYADAARVALYLGAFLLVAMLARRDTIGGWLDGIGLGILAVALVALASRLFPSLHLGSAGAGSLPAVATRLSYPLGYWNGLAIFVALAVPLVLRTAISARTLLVRCAAVGTLPLLAADVYLSSSRGGGLVAAVGGVALVLSSGRVWAAAGALLSGAVGGAVALLALHGRRTLVDGPVGSAAAVSQGHSAAALLAVAALVAGSSWLLLQVSTRSLRTPSQRTARVALVAVILAAAAALVAAHPVARFQAFKQAPIRPGAPAFTASHLLSGSGSGRWQFWSSAVDEWRSAPLVGKGAGSFAAWWASHRTLPMPAQDAHSIFFETLAELGILGALLVSIVWIGGPTLAFVRLRGLTGPARLAAASAASVAVAFAVGAALDWVWQLPAVSVVGVSALALSFAVRSSTTRRQRSSSASVALATLSLAAICFELVPLLAARALDQSRSAVQSGSPSAMSAALRARALEPWAVSPLEQLALVSESEGDLGTAQAWIDKARSANPDDWQVRLIAARIETKRGDVAAAKRDLAVAQALDPLSPLFAAQG